MRWRLRLREAAFCSLRFVRSAIRSRDYSRNRSLEHRHPMPVAPVILDGFLRLADAWISQRADDRGVAWFRGAVEDVMHAASERSLGVAIGLAPRRLGKADLALPVAELARAEALRPGLDLGDWSIDQLARVALMAASHVGNDADFAARFDSFC